MSKHYRRLSLAQGSSLCAVGLLTGLTLLVLAPRVRLLPVDLVFIFAAWFCFWFFSHDLAHHIVGRIVGVRFRYYFLGRSTITRLNMPIASTLLKVIPVLGLKIDKYSLKSVSPNKVRAMYDSGAISSMFLPWVVIPTGFSVDLPVGVLIAILTMANVGFTLYFSPRVGDLHHARMVRS